MTFAKYLYDFIPTEDLIQYKNEAIVKFGKIAIQRAEGFINKLTNDFKTKLKSEHDNLVLQLFALQHENPESAIVQEMIAKHFNSVKQFWGTVGTLSQHLEAYLDLSEKYESDVRFTMIDGKPHAGFGSFMKTAMTVFYYNQMKIRG
ncbi:hypothetical protein EP331_02960 [bacterium]|nr:MAG: hypothetical protein EP331_02960 [bacterium]